MLNHIRSKQLCAHVPVPEEYAVLAAQRAGLEPHGNATHMRALLRFTEEELKHQQLFARFTSAFARGSRSSPPCSRTMSRCGSGHHVEVEPGRLQPAPERRSSTMWRYPQQQDRESLDPLFCNMLKQFTGRERSTPGWTSWRRRRSWPGSRGAGCGTTEYSGSCSRQQGRR